jgi:hypothetical protein
VKEVYVVKGFAGEGDSVWLYRGGEKAIKRTSYLQNAQEFNSYPEAVEFLKEWYETGGSGTHQVEKYFKKA